MPDLRELVVHYVSDLKGPRADDAWHALIEIGDRCVPHLIELFRAEPEPAIRARIVEAVNQYRRPGTLRFLAEALQDPDEVVWKAALDGFVSVRSESALRVLKQADRDPGRPRQPDSERLAWIREAMEQILNRDRPGRP